MTFSTGEARLSEWMAGNAFVCWWPEPWVLEQQLVRTVSLPLNLDQNANHSFHTVLSEIRRDARLRAHALPCV